MAGGLRAHDRREAARLHAHRHRLAGWLHANQDKLRETTTVRFGPVGWASRLPALILGSQDQARKVQKDGPGGGIGRQGPGKGPGAPNLTFSAIFEPGRAVSLPWKDSLVSAQQHLPEPSFSLGFSLFRPQNLQIPLKFHYYAAFLICDLDLSPKNPLFFRKIPLLFLQT